jgi:hypothetical protein
MNSSCSLLASGFWPAVAVRCGRSGAGDRAQVIGRQVIGELQRDRRGNGGADPWRQFAGQILSAVADRAALISRRIGRSRRTIRKELSPEIDVSFSETNATRDSQTTCALRCKTRSDKTQKSSCARTFCPCDLDAGRTKLESVPTKSDGRRSIAELHPAATRVGAQTTCRLRPKLGVFKKPRGFVKTTHRSTSAARSAVEESSAATQPAPSHERRGANCRT